MTATRLAMKLLALTFVRTGELIAARWAEFDLAAAEWRIPAERMKMRTPHIVPLAPQAMEVLQILHTISGERALVFPGERDHEKCMSNNTILEALERMGYKGRMTGHGFRGVASTILHEQGHGHHLIELQLSHIERDNVAATYNHATYLTDRRAMMHGWANHIDKLRKGGRRDFPAKTGRLNRIHPPQQTAPQHLSGGFFCAFFTFYRLLICKNTGTLGTNQRNPATTVMTLP